MRSHFASLLMLSSALVFGSVAAFAQSSAGSSGGSSGGSAGGASSTGSRGGGSPASVGRAGGPGPGTAGAPAPRVGGTTTGVDRGTTAANPMLRSDPGSATSTGVPSTSDPRSLGHQPATTTAPGSTAPGTYSAGGTPAPAGTTTPSGTAYPSGTPLEAARQRAMQSPPGTAIPPAATGLGADSSGNASTNQATPGLPNTADPNRGSTDTSGDPNRLAGGGRANREGAAGANMQDCEAAWDEKTHMSKEKWRETCSRTLTDPHL
jgi:hypothetical protein